MTEGIMEQHRFEVVEQREVKQERVVYVVADDLEAAEAGDYTILPQYLNTPWERPVNEDEDEYEVTVEEILEEEWIR